MLVVEVSEAEVEAKFSEMVATDTGWRLYYADDSIRQRAADVLRAAKRAENEAAAQATIDSLSEQEARKQLAAYSARNSAARNRFTEVEKLLAKKWNEFQTEQTGNVHRDSGRYSASGITQLDEELRTLRVELREVAWWQERLGSHVAYFNKLAAEHEAEKAQQKLESLPALVDGLNKLSPEALEVLFSGPRYSGTDPVERAMQTAKQSLIEAAWHRQQRQRSKEAA